MQSPFSNRIRSERKRLRLSQQELAFLLATTRDIVSDLERYRIKPTFELVIACEFLFGRKSDALFPGASERIERDLHARIARQHDSIINQTGNHAREKIAHLAVLLSHAKPDKQNV